ncbi:hypothetical protein C5167_023397 [Papaver somniferum]|uniref:Uncharacterized protein n=1 Tax=Papaver somniferum TaxID=3469 RepID=A0A4Y7JNU3_PAPSO|nr:hypothetical protein C5167_023397 [Papaver somniferum]
MKSGVVFAVELVELGMTLQARVAIAGTYGLEWRLQMEFQVELHGIIAADLCIETGAAGAAE